MNDSPTRLELTDLDGRLGLRVAGELDSHTAPDLEARLGQLPSEGDITLDLADLTFIDSSGLRVLVAQHQRLEDAGHALILAAPSAPVARLIEITGLTEHLRVE